LIFGENHADIADSYINLGAFYVTSQSPHPTRPTPPMERT